jgi:hypothetical protein
MRPTVFCKGGFDDKNDQASDKKQIKENGSCPIYIRFHDKSKFFIVNIFGYKT